MSHLMRDYKYLARKKDIDWGWLAVLVVLILILMSGPANAYTVTTQSKDPWSINKCDKFKVKAVAVFNTSIWNSGGWPLYRVVCYYEGKTK